MDNVTNKQSKFKYIVDLLLEYNFDLISYEGDFPILEYQKITFNVRDIKIRCKFYDEGVKLFLSDENVDYSNFKLLYTDLFFRIINKLVENNIWYDSEYKFYNVDDIKRLGDTFLYVFLYDIIIEVNFNVLSNYIPTINNRINNIDDLYQFVVEFYYSFYDGITSDDIDNEMLTYAILDFRRIKFYMFPDKFLPMNDILILLNVI